MTTHQLESTESIGKQAYTCTICRQTWLNKPTSDCPGVPVYRWGQWPEHLFTKKQMSAEGFQTGRKLPPPAGMAWREKSPNGRMYLYDRAQGVPKKALSAEALAKLKAAAAKARQGWYCTRCGHPTGWVDSKGYFHAQYFNPPGLCMTCADREAAQQWAREFLAGGFLILDTETTGLSAGRDEIVQIAVIDQTGAVLLDTYVNATRPDRLISRGKDGVSASDINGITPDMLLDAPTWPSVYARLTEIVAGRKVIIYNAEFDTAMIDGDCARHGIKPVEMDAYCAMLIYAQYIGDYSSYWRDYRWHPLNGGHTALADCLACLDVIRRMADQPESTLSEERTSP